MGTKIGQYKVFWVNLDPVEGSEMAKERPCVVISPDEMNDYLKTVIIAPLTSTMKPIPSRVSVFIDGQHGMVALDHIRSISKTRIKNFMGTLHTSEIQEIKKIIQTMFVD